MSDPLPPEFEYVIRVGWGDCDPARIAYTGRIPGWALEAIDAWWEAHLDGDGWYQMELDRKFGTPFVHMEMDFTSPITPRRRLVCKVRPETLGNSSIGFRVIGTQNDRQCFSGRFVSVFVTGGTLNKRDIPEDVRNMIQSMLAPAP